MDIIWRKIMFSTQLQVINIYLLTFIKFELTAGPQARSLIGWPDLHFDPSKCTESVKITFKRTSRENRLRYRYESCGA